SRRRHTRFSRDWSSDVCSSDLRTRAAHCLQELLRQHPKIRLTGNRVGHERLTGYSLHLVLHGGKIMVKSLLRTVRLDRYGSVVEIGRAACRERVGRAGAAVSGE